MIEKVDIQENKQEELVFSQRLDFYWQSISLYAIALIVYSLLKGTIDNNTFSIKILDPVVLLLSFFIFITAIVLLINIYKRRFIIIGSDYIIFRSRFREKKYYLDDIISILISKESLGKIKNSLRVIKIRLNSRKSPIIIRNSSFKEEHKLLIQLLRLKHHLKQQKPEDLSRKRRFRLNKNLFNKKQ